MTDVRSTLEAAFPAGSLHVPTDDSNWTVGGARPEAVVTPSSSQEVVDVLASATRASVGIVPLGRGTDVGCEPPTGPWVALSTADLGGIEDYEPADLTVTAGAGTTLGELADELSAHGQWLPADPPFFHRRTLGGLVATGAAGPLATTYGAPRDHVLGLTVVTGDGRVLELGGRVMKNVAGFDLVKLVVGSRGTLGVVTSATVRLFPRPEEERVLVVAGARPGDLVAAARAVATSPVVPASAVLVSPPPPGVAGEAALLVRLQGASAAVEAEEARLLAGARLEAVRFGGPQATSLLSAGDHAASADLVVRAAALPALLSGLLSAVTDALPGAMISADVLAGRLRAGVVDGAAVDAATLATLRRRVEAVGGGVVLERASQALAVAVHAYGDRGRAGALGAALRARFDPHGVLSPGRFVR